MPKINPLFQMFLFAILFTLSLTAKADALQALLHHKNDPIAGNPKGKITVVEFFDYQCSHCISMAPVLSDIIKANPDVRVVFKEFPIRGAMSQFAARAALAANLQGKYATFSHALLESSQPLTEESILKIAKSQGLNITKLKKEMNEGRIRDQLNANIKLAQELQLTGTPAFYIGKTNSTNMDQVHHVLGEMSQSELQNAIDQVRA